MFNLVFYNVGGKIKLFSKILTLLGIVASVVIGAYLIKNGLNAATSKEIYYGIGVIIGGSVATVVVNYFIYGIGELISTAQNIDCKLDIIVNKGKKEV